MKLVIVESPTKTKSLSKYLGTGYEVMATMGHMVDLPKSKLGVEVKKIEDRKLEVTKIGFKFRPEYELSEGKEKTAKELIKAAAKADKIILASDPDREGEAIAWHTQQVLSNKLKGKSKKEDKKIEVKNLEVGKKKKKTGIDASKFERVVFHSITKEAIEEAMKQPRQVDMAMVDAQQARRVLDRIVGYQLSPVLWKKVRRGLSAGRVQSVAVRLIVDKEKEIGVFKPVEYWEIKVQVRTQGTKNSRNQDGFWVELVKRGGKPVTINDEKTAREIEVDLNIARYEVGKVERKERHLYPHPPFKTSTMQQAAANILGWSAKKTMSVAQRLYEKGAITYHRTDSLNLVVSAIEEIRRTVVKEFGKEYLPDKEIYYKTSGKVVAQEAHEAIRPTRPQLRSFGGQAQEDVDKDEEKLYQLIWRRTVACQMKSALIDQTVIWVVAENKENYQLRAVGEVMKFASWKKLYKLSEEVILPAVNDDEKLVKEKVEATQKFTLPPARFNDASLIKELEKRGIGRPSTYAPTISTIIVRGYVERKQKKFYATSVGVTVSDFLVKNFPKEMDFEFTAKMEADLDEIASGSKDWQKVLSDFYGPFEESVEKATTQAERVKVPVESTGRPCPLCGTGEIVIRTGKFGKFYSCSRFPECKYTAKIIEYVEGVVCPKDGGRVVVKKTKTGRDFYGCENYPKCDYASWNRPTPEATERQAVQSEATERQENQKTSE